MDFVLETNRLKLRQFTSADIEAIFKLDSNPQVHQYLGNKPISSMAKAERTIENFLTQYRENQIGRWAVFQKKDNSFVGWSGIKLETGLYNGYQNYYDLGFRLLPEYWGKGYAFESAQVALSDAFTRLKLETVHAAADVANKASNSNIKKLGFSFKNDFLYDCRKHNWYSLSKRNYKTSL